MTHFTSQDFISAGLATMSRQCICGYLAHKFPITGDPITTAALLVLKHAAHKADVGMTILDSATRATIILTEQAAFPLFLQVFNRFYGLIEAQIETEEDHLALFKIPVAFYHVLSPLHWLIMGMYADAFQAHIDAHKSIIYAPWEMTTATVTKVIDGDTIKTDASTKSIRIRKLKCPELSEAGGEAAKEYATNRLLYKEVKLIAEHHCDQYSRILADVLIGETDFADEMIAMGFCEEWEE